MAGCANCNHDAERHVDSKCLADGCDCKQWVNPGSAADMAAIADEVHSEMARDRDAGRA